MPRGNENWAELEPRRPRGHKKYDLPDHESCPHCYSVIREGARHCSICGAQKGYIVVLDRVYGWVPVVLFGIVVPLLGLALTLVLGDISFGSVVVAALLVVLIIYAYLTLTSGPYWFSHTARMWLALKSRRERR